MEGQGPKPGHWKERGLGGRKEGAMGRNGRKQGHGVGGRDSAGRRIGGWRAAEGAGRMGLVPILSFVPSLALSRLHGSSPSPRKAAGLTSQQGGMRD